MKQRRGIWVKGFAIASIAAVVTLQAMWAADAGNREADILEIDLAKGLALPEVRPSWLTDITFRGGNLLQRQEGAVWSVEADMPVGEGRMDFWLNREFLPDALALVILFKPMEGTDLAVQLYDAEGQVVAVDLFGNLAETREVGASDTFVVPLRKYPTAARVAIRRITGPVMVTGLAAFPVVEELDALSRSEEEAFVRLLEASDAGSQKVDRTFRILRERELRMSNAIAEQVIGVPGYPHTTWQAGKSAEEVFSISVSGTAYRFITNLLIQMFPFEENLMKGVSFTSSKWASEALVNGDTQAAVVSRMPTTEQLRKFHDRCGFDPIIIPIALDAVEVIVHPANALDSISFADLRAIFSGTMDWSAFPQSVMNGEIVAVGGHPEWGTSKTFAEAIGLQGGFLPSLVVRDIAFPHGVEEFVSKDIATIGFAQYRPRKHVVKSLDIATGAGMAPVGVSPETVYGGTYPLTRKLYLLLGWEKMTDLPGSVRNFVDILLSYEGQSEVALAGNLPLEKANVMMLRQEMNLR